MYKSMVINGKRFEVVNHRANNDAYTREAATARTARTWGVDLMDCYVKPSLENVKAFNMWRDWYAGACNPKYNVQQFGISGHNRMTFSIRALVGRMSPNGNYIPWGEVEITPCYNRVHMLH